MVIFGVLALSIGVRLYNITTPVLWLDEAFSVYLSRMPPGQILLHTARDVHPPLYYLLLHYWMALFGDGLLAVRGLSVFTGVATVLVAMHLTLQMANRRAALVAGLLMAVLPIAVRYSQEVRMYSLLALLLLVATFALMMWMRAPERRQYLLLYALSLTAAFYTHYFAVLCALAHWLFMLLMSGEAGRRYVWSKAWWLCNLSIALMFLPWLPTLLAQMANPGAVSWIPEVTLHSVPSTLWQFLALEPGTGHAWPVFWLLPLSIAGLSLVIARADDAPSKPCWLILAFTWIPLLAAWLLSYALPLFMARYLLFTSSGLVIVLAVLLDRQASRQVSVAIAMAALIVSLNVAGLHRTYAELTNLNGRTAWGNIRLDKLLGMINAQWKHGDAIVVEGLHWYYTVDYYNQTGSQPLVYMWGERGDNSGKSELSYTWATLIYPKSEQLYVVDPKKLRSMSGRVWWIGKPPTPGAAAYWSPDWTLQAQMPAGDIQALLFTLPDPARP